ncbi:MAG: hypothetical protein ACFCVE_00910 [Phycisphaerae bacterium]
MTALNATTGKNEITIDGKRYIVIPYEEYQRLKHGVVYTPEEEQQRQQRRTDALKQLAAAGVFKDIRDPVEWQRQQRGNHDELQE